MSHPAAQITSHRSARFHRADAIPATPPGELLDAIGAAAAAYERLEASGRQVRFTCAPGGLTIQVLDTEGELLGTVSPRDLLELAAGAPLL